MWGNAHIKKGWKKDCQSEPEAASQEAGLAQAAGLGCRGVETECFSGTAHSRDFKQNKFIPLHLSSVAFLSLPLLLSHLLTLWTLWSCTSILVRIYAVPTPAQPHAQSCISTKSLTQTREETSFLRAASSPSHPAPAPPCLCNTGRA